MTSEETILGQILAQQEYFQQMEARQVVEVPPATGALLIGPHPDDIVLGCGGTVLKYRDRGTPLHFVCLTDGRACVSDPRERERIVALRETEERTAAARCGAHSVEYFAFPEDRLSDPAELDGLASRLRAAIESVRPDAVFVPYWLELHPLHRYTAFLLAKALQSCTLDLIVYCYEVVSLVPPAFVVDITASLEEKKEIVRLYQSQLATRDYIQDLELLNGQRARLAGPGSAAAEVFQGFPRVGYVDRVLPLGLERPAVLGGGAQPMKPEEG